MATNAISDMFEESLTEVEGGAKGSVAILKLYNRVVYLKILIRESSPNSNSGKKAAIARDHPKVCDS